MQIGKFSADVAEFFRQPFPYLVCIRQIGGQIFLPGLWFLQVLPLRTETYWDGAPAYNVGPFYASSQFS